MTTTLPSYSALPPELPPHYSRREGEEEENVTTEAESSDHRQYDPPPSFLNEDSDPLVNLPRVYDHYILTLVMMILCSVLLNFPAFLCLVPAISLSRKSKRALENREYMEARSKAQWALWLNMAAVISYLMMMIFFIGLIVAVIFSVT